MTDEAEQVLADLIAKSEELADRLDVARAQRVPHTAERATLQNACDRIARNALSANQAHRLELLHRRLRASADG